MVVSRQQYFSALATLGGSMTQLYQAVPMDINDPIWIAFNAATTVAEGDTLAVFTQTTLGWTSAQMTALFQTASALPGGTSCTNDPTVFNGNAVTAYDIITLAFKDAGILGIGQSMLAEDYNDALLRLN